MSNFLGMWAEEILLFLLLLATVFGITWNRRDAFFQEASVYMKSASDAWWDLTTNAKKIKPSALDYFLINIELLCQLHNTHRWIGVKGRVEKFLDMYTRAIFASFRRFLEQDNHSMRIRRFFDAMVINMRGEKHLKLTEMRKFMERQGNREEDLKMWEEMKEQGKENPK